MIPAGLSDEASSPREAARAGGGARLFAAVLTFFVLMAAAVAAGRRASWFPHDPVYRFPAWTPLNLGMIDEAVWNARKRAGGKTWAILIGDSIPHGDGYGKPSETFGADLDRLIPTANLTSPSLAYEPESDLLQDALAHTDAPIILVQLNLKWVAHEWVPGKFVDLRSELEVRRRDTGAIKEIVRGWLDRTTDALLLKKIKLKARYRLTNFTLLAWGANGLTADFAPLWAYEFRQEAKPKYEVQKVGDLTPDKVKEAAAYESLTPAQIDASLPLNALIAEMTAGRSRVVAVLTPFNPAWCRAVAPDSEPNAGMHYLQHRLAKAGIRVITVALDGDDNYRDDMHFTVNGAHEAARQVAASLSEMNR